MSNEKSRLEVFLALNAEAFRRGLAGTVTTSKAAVGQIEGAFTKNKGAIDQNTASLKASTAATMGLGQATNVLRLGLATLLAPLAAIFSITAGVGKLVTVTREFDKLNAGLITATGSAAGAKTAFAALEDFAAKTPYDLAQVTDSFIKLVNFGLNPSQRALTSYGNTSSALGKDLNQMIEAVADAATGEFERLKEFGIKAKIQGDTVSFTFRGITTTVGKNAQEIEEYLIRLGEINFGDAMANRMSTLDGALSNFGDSWDKLFRTVSDSGIGDMIAKAVNLANDALDRLSSKIASGELEESLKASAGKWAAWAKDVSTSINFVRETFTTDTDGMKSLWGELIEFLIDAFKYFPENVRAMLGLMSVGVTSFFDKIKAEARLFVDVYKAIFTNETLDVATNRFVSQIRAINQAKDASIDAILKERNTALDSYAKQTEAAKRLRQQHAWREANKPTNSDSLAQFRVSGDDTTIAATKRISVSMSEMARAGEDAYRKILKEANESATGQKRASAEAIEEMKKKYQQYVAQIKTLQQELETRSLTFNQKLRELGRQKNLASGKATEQSDYKDRLREIEEYIAASEKAEKKAAAALKAGNFLEAEQNIKKMRENAEAASALTDRLPEQLKKGDKVIMDQSQGIQKKMDELKKAEEQINQSIKMSQDVLRERGEKLKKESGFADLTEGMDSVEKKWLESWVKMQDKTIAAVDAVEERIEKMVEKDRTVYINVKERESRSSGGLIGYMAGGLITALRMAGGGTVTAFRNMLSGGHFPGFGGGDRRHVIAEDGEYMLDKYRVRDAGLNTVRAFHAGRYDIVIAELSKRLRQGAASAISRSLGGIIDSIPTMPAIGPQFMAAGGQVVGGGSVIRHEHVIRAGNSSATVYTDDLNAGRLLAVLDRARRMSS